MTKSELLLVEAALNGWIVESNGRIQLTQAGQKQLNEGNWFTDAPETLRDALLWLLDVAQDNDQAVLSAARGTSFLGPARVDDNYPLQDDPRWPKLVRSAPQFHLESHKSPEMINEWLIPGILSVLYAAYLARELGEYIGRGKPAAQPYDGMLAVDAMDREDFPALA